MFKILSTGSALPALSKTNDDLSTFLDTSDEWISQRTGIRQRSLCSDETLTDLLTVAAKQALERAGVEPQQLDLILCATIRGEYITPSQACVIQQQLGAGCPAMDISAACTGFVYALDVAAGYFARKKVKKMLVLAGDTMSRLVDWNDRSTCVLFGDGAGAVLLGEGDSLQSIHLTAKGDPQVLCIPQPQSNSPFDILPPQQPHFLKGVLPAIFQQVEVAAAALYGVTRLQVLGREAVEVAVFTELVFKQQRIPSQRKKQLAVLTHQIQKMLLPMLHRISENGKLMAPDGAEIQMKPAGI